MGKIIVKYLGYFFLAVGLIFIILNLLFSNRESIEYKMMKNEPGRYFYKAIGCVPDEYSFQFRTSIIEETSTFTLFRVVHKSDESTLLYI